MARRPQQPRHPQKPQDPTRRPAGPPSPVGGSATATCNKGQPSHMAPAGLDGCLRRGHQGLLMLTAGQSKHHWAGLDRRRVSAALALVDWTRASRCARAQECNPGNRSALTGRASRGAAHTATDAGGCSHVACGTAFLWCTSSSIVAEGTASYRTSRVCARLPIGRVHPRAAGATTKEDRRIRLLA